MTTALEDSIAAREAEIVEEFGLFSDWTDKYEHLISLGKELPLIDEGMKSDDLLIKGCQSRVWLQARLQNGRVIFTADSDAIITKGVISLLIRVLSGLSPQQIIDAELTFIERIGLKEHLSPTRSNGLVSMIRQMKFYAIAFRSIQHTESHE
jgi:cysteine desulfuration protein SufE